MSRTYKPRSNPYELRLGLTLLERLLDKCTLKGTCIVYNGHLDEHGYGSSWRRGHRKRTHREMYEAFLGPVPGGLSLDHLCRNRACVNPAHLEPVTDRENVLRGFGPGAVNARKTHCVRDHAYDEANTYKVGGRRRCRKCATIRQRDYRRRKAAA